MDRGRLRDTDRSGFRTSVGGRPNALQALEDDLRETRTNERGEYRLKVRVDMATEIVVYDSRFVPWHTQALLRDRADKRMDIELPDGHQLTCTLENAMTGAPVANARVTARRMDRELARSDSTGRFTLQIDGGDEVSIEVEAEDFCRLSWTGRVQRTEALRLPMLPTVRIEGIVQDSLGSTVAGAWVSIEPFDADEPEAAQYDLPSFDHFADEFGVPGTVSYDKQRGLAAGEDGRFEIETVPFIGEGLREGRRLCTGRSRTRASRGTGCEDLDHSDSIRRGPPSRTAVAERRPVERPDRLSG